MNSSESRSKAYKQIDWIDSIVDAQLAIINKTSEYTLPPYLTNLALERLFTLCKWQQEKLKELKFYVTQI